LADLRATWAAFPTKDDRELVERFMARVRNVAPGSGLDFEIEHHLSELGRLQAERRAREVLQTEVALARKKAEAEEQRKQEEEHRARETALSTWIENDLKRCPAKIKPLSVWRDAIPGLTSTASPEMVTMPTGRFLMGSPEDEAGRYDSEGPQHEVQIHYPFAMGKFPITFEQWDAAIDAGASLRRIGTGAQSWASSDQGWGRGTRPVIGITWGDAQDYISWLNEQLRSCADGPYCLPSEAEWEYACRAGTDAAFSFGATILPTQANFGGEAKLRSGSQKSKGATTPVGSYRANAFGLHDMHGNVYEWCEDGWSENYNDAPSDGTARYTERGPVVRGGSFYDDARHLRSAYRTWPSPPMLVAEVGFRLARMLHSSVH
ncbi:MAG: formylglycine-generating enzyme family protein, partial [Alphaproteobacteria bacterium]|nr:formylglycine-generating enzyme family protein [Alphaproteobacteria bacterium]